MDTPGGGTKYILVFHVPSGVHSYQTVCLTQSLSQLQNTPTKQVPKRCLCPVLSPGPHRRWLNQGKPWLTQGDQRESLTRERGRWRVKCNLSLCVDRWPCVPRPMWSKKSRKVAFTKGRRLVWRPSCPGEFHQFGSCPRRHTTENSNSKNMS